MNSPDSEPAELTRLITACTDLVQGDERVQAAWLAGSFGRGDADAFSDIDLHVLLLSETDVSSIEEDIASWLASVASFVGTKKVFTHLYHCVTTDGDRIDVNFHIGSFHEADLATIAILKNENSGLRHAEEPIFDPARTFAMDVGEIWRMTLLLPVMIGREEYLRLFHGISIKYGFVINLLVRGRGYPRPVGAKKLNELLLPEDRVLLAEAVSIPVLDAVRLARADLRLAAIVRDLGPACCARIGIDYPEEWEAVTRKRLQKELPRLGLSDVLRETLDW